MPKATAGKSAQSLGLLPYTILTYMKVGVLASPTRTVDLLGGLYMVDRAHLTGPPGPSPFQELLPRQGGVHVAGQWRYAHAGGRGRTGPFRQW